MGLHDLFRPVQRAILTNSVESEPGKTSFLRAQFEATLEGNKVTVANNQEELVGLSDANCLVVIGEDVASLNAATEVDVMMLERRYI